MKKRLIEEFLNRYNPSDKLEKAYRMQTIEFLKDNKIVLGKENKNGHLTGSAWIVNRDKSKTLLTHHNKLNRWLQLGGHTEPNEDILTTALREAKEESGLSKLSIISSEIFDIDIQSIPEYMDEKEHYHYDIRFIIEADENHELMVTNESKDLKWVFLDDVENYNKCEAMKRMVKKTQNT